jgi:hypothetical protein
MSSLPHARRCKRCQLQFVPCIRIADTLLLCHVLQTAGHLASLQSSAGHRLGPVWALLLESPQHASLLSNASQGYAQFLRDLERRWVVPDHILC